MPQQPAHNPIGEPFIVLQSVDSTNNYALGRVHAGLAHHGEAIFTHEQVAGKGQRGRSWASEKDANIILSIIINPHPLQVSEQFQLSACIAVAVHEYLSKYIGDDAKIKWPNDIYWQDRKTGGILIESVIGGSTPVNGEALSVTHSAWQSAVVGIGINVNQTSFPGELINPVSVKQITGKTFNPEGLSKELCVVINKRFNELVNEGFKNIYAYYTEQLYKKDQLVKFKKDNRSFDAIIKSVSPNGQLIVEHAIEEAFDFGSVEWIVK